MNVNIQKSKIVHFRRKSDPITKVYFTIGNNTLVIVNQYKYLEIYVNEFLDFNVITV